MKISAAATALLAALAGAAPAQAHVRAFFSPSIDGLPVAACMAGNAHCGKQAADAFCRFEGYDRAILFERQAARQSRSLGDGATCSGPSCTAFRQVKCFSTKEDLAQAGAAAGTVQ